MDKIRTIYLLRHGKIDLGPDRRRYIGQIDLPLTEDGIEQAKRLQHRLGRVDLTALYCSDLSRSRKTAELVASGRNNPILERKDLREISLGEWEGRTFAEIAQQYPQEFKARGADIGYYRVPGGESFADCSSRIVAAFHHILDTSTGDIVISGHAGTNRLLLCYILGMPLNNLFRISQDYGCMNSIQYNGTYFQVKAINTR